MLAPLPLYALLPFVAMLLAIALLPLAWPHWWEPNRNKLLVSAVLGLPVLLLYLVRGPAALVHTAGDYASFIILQTGLYVIAGGIQLRGDLEATPAVNTAFLGAGALLASLIGTTGASMLLIRALLQTNRERARVTHTVVFFIFLVSNIGGMLTPLGDPPLFLGYLAGVPFSWTLRLWAPWLAMLLSLLALYFGWDTIQHRRETPAARRRDRALVEPLRLHGGSTPSGWPGWWPRWRCCTRPSARSPSWLSPGSRSGERPGRSAAPTSSPPIRWWRWRSSSSASSSP
jgi:Na+/H+ antiporter NhaD/arsenite permease-like protein